MLSKLKDLLGSRKFYMTVIGLILNAMNTQLNWFSPEQMLAFTAMIGSWVVGQGMADSKPDAK